MDNDRKAVLICLADLYSDCAFIENKEVRYNIEISIDSLKEHFQITDITKQDKRVEVRMIDEGAAFNVELRPYKVNDIDDVIHEVLNGLPSYALPLGEEAEEFTDELVEEEIREYITYYADL